MIRSDVVSCIRRHSNSARLGFFGDSYRVARRELWLLVFLTASASHVPAGAATQVAAPTASPAGGIYHQAQSVSLADATSGALIYYTTDGSLPNRNSALYRNPIPVAVSTTLRAVAFAAGPVRSATTSARYTIVGGAAAPTLSPAGGIYLQAQTVTLTDSSAGARIYYTTDGSKPTTGSTLYTGPIKVVSTEIIQAVASAPGGVMSSVVGATYSIPAETVLHSFAGSEGAFPAASVIQGSDGTLYGTAPGRFG